MHGWLVQNNDAVNFYFIPKKDLLWTLDDGKSYACLYYIFDKQYETYDVLETYMQYIL